MKYVAIGQANSIKITCEASVNIFWLACARQAIGGFIGASSIFDYFYAILIRDRIKAYHQSLMYS
jgi:hypothetical protein